MRGYAEMHDATTLVVQDDEHEQEPKRGSRHDEEIDGRQTVHMVPKECPPGLRASAALTKQIDLSWVRAVGSFGGRKIRSDISIVHPR